MNRRAPIILTVLIIAFLGVLTWAVYNFVTRDYPGTNDFYQRWYASQAFWVQGRDPYSRSVAREVEIKLYGHEFNPDPALDEYPGDFLYPFPTAIILAPLTPLDFAWASAIWIVITWACVAASFLAMIDLFNWRAPTWFVGLGIAWTAFFYPATRGMFLGQMGTVVVCLELLAVWALVKKQDTLAGILLALSIFKPQIGFLIIPFLVLWSLRFRRWRFLVSFTIGSAVLVGGSFLLLPSWLGEWLAQAANYAGYTHIGSPVSVITGTYLTFLGSLGELVIDGLLVLLVLWGWYRVIWQQKEGWFVWAGALSLSVTHLIALRTATPHFVVYLIVLVFLFREIARLNRRTGPILSAMVMLLIGAGLWILFLTTLQNKFENPINYLPLPFGALIILWFMRERWNRDAAKS